MGLLLHADPVSGEVANAPGLKVKTQKVSFPTPAPKIAPRAKSSPTIDGKEDIKTLILSEMEKVGYRAPLFALRVAQCESGLNPLAKGDGGKSYGIWQIFLPAHPTITKEQALDPVWSTTWAAEQFAAGRASLWTCAKILS